jgi:hypothetical protein
MIYYVAVKGAYELLLTTSRKAAADHVGVHARTLTRHFREKGRYEGDGCYVLVSDFLKRQSRKGPARKG